MAGSFSPFQSQVLGGGFRERLLSGSRRPCLSSFDPEVCRCVRIGELKAGGLKCLFSSFRRIDFVFAVAVSIIEEWNLSYAVKRI